MTVYSCHDYSPPLPHRRTHPHSPTRQMHLPAKIRPERENTFPEISVTYICEQTRSQARTHTNTDVVSVAVGFHCFHFLLDCLFMLAVYPQGGSGGPVSHANLWVQLGKLTTQTSPSLASSQEVPRVWICTISGGSWHRPTLERMRQCKPFIGMK